MRDECAQPNDLTHAARDITVDLEPTDEAAAEVIGGRDPSYPVLTEISVSKPIDR